MKSETKIELKNEDGVYTTNDGTKLSSVEIAGTLKEAIDLYNNQIKSTKDVRKIKKLNERLRSIRLWIAQRPDVKHFIQ
jgi:hypothetical protein